MLLPRLMPAGLVAPALISTVLSLAGCAHRVVIASEPTGATVRYDKRIVGVTPLEFTPTWVPFRKMDVRVELSGYRTDAVWLHKDTGPLRLAAEVLTLRWRRLLGIRVRTHHEVILVRNHGRSGTWTPDEAMDR